MKTERRLICILLVLMLILSVSACGGKVSLKSISHQEEFWGNIGIGTSVEDLLKTFPEAESDTTVEGLPFYRIVNLDDDNFLFTTDFFVEDGKVSQIADRFRLKKIDGDYTEEEVRDVFTESVGNIKGYFTDKYGEGKTIIESTDRLILEWIVDNNYVSIMAFNYTEGQSDEFLASITVGLVPAGTDLTPLTVDELFGGISIGMSESDMLAKTGITTDAVIVEGKKMYTQTVRDDVLYLIERGFSVNEDGIVDAVTDRYKLKKPDKEFTQEEINANFRQSVLNVITLAQNLYHADFGDELFTEYENVSVNKSVKLSGESNIIIFGSTRNEPDLGEEHSGKFNIMIYKE
ncbi:MAG: hypothetical protein E7218_04855 [Anaerofustis stercorihominis]|nr:hypothetical protein [Anaerofustis stercorihominis]